MGLIRLIGHFGDYFENVGGFDAGVAFGCGPVFGGSGVPFGASGVEFKLGAEGGFASGGGEEGGGGEGADGAGGEVGVFIRSPLLESGVIIPAR